MLKYTAPLKLTECMTFLISVSSEERVSFQISLWNKVLHSVTKKKIYCVYLKRSGDPVNFYFRCKQLL